MKAHPLFRIVLLAAVCFSLATLLQPRALDWSERAQADSVLKMLLGDGRRLFANHFFVQADVYFHGGYYPSIFDQASKPRQSRSPMVSGQNDEHGHEEERDADEAEHDAHAGHDHAEQDHDAHDAEAQHEREMAFLNRPRDWIEAFGRKFMITEHTHLAAGREREILPWLRLSAELDPQRVETYTVAAFWLRTQLGKIKEAEQFLHEGLSANPSSPELLFELGRLYSENYHDTNRARNTWVAALRRWDETEAGKEEPNKFVLAEITVNLGRLEEAAGNYDQAVMYLQRAKTASPAPQLLEQQIQEIREKRSGTAN